MTNIKNTQNENAKNQQVEDSTTNLRILTPLSALNSNVFKQENKSTDDQLIDNNTTEKVDHHKLLFESKSKKTYQSHKQMILEIKRRIRDKLMNNEKINIQFLHEEKRIKLNSYDISDFLFDTCDIAKLTDDNNLNSLIFIENPDTNIMISDTNYLEIILADLCRFIDVDIKRKLTVEPRLDIDDISKMSTKVLNHLKNRSDIRKLCEIPTRYLVTKNDLVIDLITKEIKSVKDSRLEFDIINKSNVNFIDFSSLSKKEIEKLTLNQTIIERIMKDWSNEDKEVEYLLWQIIYSVLQNDNHGKFFIIKGPGGNGKSTFMELLASIAGEKNTVRANIHQFGDPNAINKISMQTRVIIGDDAATNHKLSSSALSNMKSLTTGQRLSLPMKYKENVIVQTRAPFIQGTNTDISFFENNKALSSRLIAINWSPTDFRSNKSTIDFNLDELIFKQDFIDVLFMMCIDYVAYFNEFIIPVSVKATSAEMLDSNDNVKQYLEENIDRFNCLPKIPTKLLYHDFIDWLKLNNPSSSPMKVNTFTKLIKEKADEFNFSIGSDRSTFRSVKFKNTLKNIFNTDDKLFKLSQSSISFNNPISEKEVEEFVNQSHPLEKINHRQMQILNIAINDYKHTFLQSLYNDTE